MDRKLESLKDKQNHIFVEIAGILSGIASPVRVKLIHFLSQGPLTVETLSGKTGESVANTSMHLRKMLTQKIVSVSVLGKNRLYSLHPAAFKFWESCQDFAQSVEPSINLHPEEIYAPMEWPESLKVTIKKAKKNEVVLVDARPADEAAPLKGLKVIHLPSSEIAKGALSLPKKKPVLVFCRGRLCALSAFAVHELRKKGVNAYRLNESWYALNEAM